MSVIKLFDVASTFNISAPAGFKVEGFSDDSNHNIPRTQKDYVFRKEYLRDVLAFLMNPGNDGLYLSGPMGAGKTSLISQVASRLNWPVQIMTCRGSTEYNELVGQFRLVNGSMEFVHAQLAIAMREGHVFILNEIDVMDPSELSGLNDIIEGGDLFIPQNNGEVIKPHPKFRFIATANSAGFGDDTGLYQGVMQQNMAFMDRFRYMDVSYPSSDDELSILKSISPVIPDDVLIMMIKLANEVRNLFIGSNDSSAELSVTMSTRVLARWVRLLMSFKGSPNALEYSFRSAFLVRARPEDKEAIERLAKDVFGDNWG